MKRPLWIFRSILALSCLGLFVWRFLTLNDLITQITKETSGVSIAYSETVKHAIDLYVGESSSWAQATMVLLGVLAALWIAKREDPRLLLRPDLLPEIVMWFVSACMLGASLYCHNEYVGALARALEAAVPSVLEVGHPLKIINVFVGKYDVLRSEQFRLLIFGAVVASLAVFSVRNLWGGSDVEK
jgi:hypothetical protein